MLYFLAELVHQLDAVAVVEPGILLTGIEAERHRAEQRPGRVLADVVVRDGVAHLDGAVLHASTTASGGTISPAANT